MENLLQMSPSTCLPQQAPSNTGSIFLDDIPLVENPSAFGINTAEAEFLDMVKQSQNSTALFGITMFPNHFSIPFSDYHRYIFGPIDDPTKQHVALAAPRGWGKTTIIELAYPLRIGLFQIPPLHWISLENYKPFIILTAATYDQAVEHLDTIKAEIETNDRIELAFGKQKGRIWREDRIELVNGTYIVAKGAGQQLRGLKHGATRPTLIILDDMLTAELVMSEDRRKKLKRWLYSDVMYAGANSGIDAKISVIGTLLHQDDLLSNLLEDENWYGYRLEAFDDNLNSNWPEKESNEYIQKQYDLAQSQGQLSEFLQEKRNIIIAVEDAAFHQEDFLHYDIGDSIYQMVTHLMSKDAAPRCVIVDPARTVNMASDFSAAVGIVIDQRAGSAFFHSTLNKRLTPEALIHSVFEMADNLNTTKIFIKNTGLELWGLTAWRSAMLEKGKIYDLMAIPEKGKKEDRIAKLAALYRIKMIHHNKRECAALERQLLAHPRAKHDDLADAAADLIFVLDNLGGWDYTNPMQDTEKAWQEIDDSDIETEVAPEEWNVI